MPETLYLFRHCAVDPRLRGIGRGSLDYPLSDDGLRMSLEIAKFLCAEKIQKVITTGRRRTDIIGQTLATHGIDHSVEKRFQELHLLPIKSWEEIVREFPEDAALYGQDTDALAFPQGEKPEQVRNRVIEAWIDWQRQNIEKLAIIAHDTSNHWLLAQLKGEKSESMPQSLGGMFQIVFRHEEPTFVRENVLVTDIYS